MDVTTKVQLAIDFINAIRAAPAADLNRQILEECGEDLAQFFLRYSANLIAKEPNRVVENTSALMLMGYLIAKHEESLSALGPMQGQRKGQA